SSCTPGTGSHAKPRQRRLDTQPQYISRSEQLAFLPVQRLPRPRSQKSFTLHDDSQARFPSTIADDSRPALTSFPLANGGLTAANSLNVCDGDFSSVDVSGRRLSLSRPSADASFPLSKREHRMARPDQPCEGS